MDAHRTGWLVAVLAAIVALVVLLVADGRSSSPDRTRGDGGSRASPPSPPPYDAYDQWIELRGGPPAIVTGMGPAVGRVPVARRLLPRRATPTARRIHRDRPAGFEPVAIVLHATGSGEPGSEFPGLDAAWRFFARPSARSSAHFAIDRRGGVLQLVDLDDSAFHVATPGWNDVSIGIELLNDNSGSQDYPKAQRAALTQLVRSLGARYGIPVEAVVRHGTIQPRDRRDPVGFPWREWLATLR